MVRLKAVKRCLDIHGETGRNETDRDEADRNKTDRNKTGRNQTEEYKGKHDGGKSRQMHAGFCSSHDSGKLVSAVLQSGGFHDCGETRRTGCTGGGRCINSNHDALCNGSHWHRNRLFGGDFPVVWGRKNKGDEDRYFHGSYLHYGFFPAVKCHRKSVQPSDSSSNEDSGRHL